MRRDSNDVKWREVKEKVLQRDRSCRLCKILSPQEYSILRKNAGALLFTLDPAHYLPVGQYPELCYKSYNICLLNRFSHSMLDSYKNPITSTSITKEEVQNWWLRILKGDLAQYNYLKEKGLINDTSTQSKV